ncbi:CopG family transcriptional regulator [Pseudomonas chlororaphis]|uniref:ribbon-helix-helix domain-containing protein n=1 Tax=Pseudomonas chlororaphis TaxID=587753 RepID=UPI001473697D|nr:CopG family transcriptional regulator [Pseudomonas chlororaphis]NNB47601.1 ribbon-helix-helix protein, CopG family [Pseudomonas chlororaphis]
MANRRVQASRKNNERTIRASISFTEEQYVELEQLATTRHVSLAWVVREAVQRYLTECPQMPTTEPEELK